MYVYSKSVAIRWIAKSLCLYSILINISPVYNKWKISLTVLYFHLFLKTYPEFISILFWDATKSLNAISFID